MGKAKTIINRTILYKSGGSRMSRTGGDNPLKQGNLPWLWNPEETSSEVQKGGISGLKNYQKKKKVLQHGAFLS